MSYVMLIDDDEDFASAAAEVLSGAGHEVRVELDIEGAVKNMEERHPDLVVLDVMFPEDPSAGFELARTMRHHSEKLKSIPILMLTAINARFPLGFGAHDIDENWLPVTDFLEKPIDLDVLTRKVSELLKRGRPEEAASDEGDEA